MKRGALHFLGRKNQSLFDTNIKIQEMDNVELVLDSSAIPETGTAKVRARPTVKHHIASSDSLYAFAVPTPKVPDLPSLNGLKTNGSVGGDQLSNGSTISVPDLVEGEIIVPPPPSMAPPPPPSQFIPPPPYFMGDLDSAAILATQPPSMPPPKPPSLEDLTLLKPPPMAPPKPPSTCSSASTASVLSYSPPPSKILGLSDCPKFAPPKPPSEKQHKTSKAPPPKPIRWSSVPSIDILPQDISQSPSAQTATPSSFNPQNTAKLYNVPKTSILGGHVDRDTRAKQIVLFEDSGAGRSSPVSGQLDGKAPSTASPSKPVYRNSNGTQLDKDLQEFKENFQAKCPSNTSQLQPKPEAKDKIDSIPQKHNDCPSLPQISPRLQEEPSAQVSRQCDQVKHEVSPNQYRRFSPLIDRKLRNLKGAEASGTREGPAASPLALLMAAKEREKHRPTLSRQNSDKGNEECRASIHHSDSSPNSFVVIPRSISHSSLTSKGGLEGRPKSVSSLKPTLQATVQTSRQPSTSALAFTTPALGGKSTATSQSFSNLKNHSLSECARNESDGQELSMPLLPPPPEFANIDLNETSESPPSFPPPDPPVKKAPLPKVPFPLALGPSPPPKPKPAAAPLLPPPIIGIPKPALETKPKPPFAQPPSPLSASKATLLSILQKKMLEMDRKIVPKKETEKESGGDDWGSPVSDEETNIPFVRRAAPQNKSYVPPSKTTTLDMRELESKVKTKIHQDNLSPKSTASNGAQSKQQCGMTFTVRPGTKTPITLVSKGDSS